MSDDLGARVAELLNSLGQTADEVADALQAKRITGQRDAGGACPIANLIAAEIPQARAGGTEWDDAEGCWWVTCGYIRTPEGDIDPPAAVSEFIEVFDNGEPASDYFHRPYWFLEASR